MSLIWPPLEDFSATWDAGSLSLFLVSSSSVSKPCLEGVWQGLHTHVSPGMKLPSSWKMSWRVLLAQATIPASGPALEQPVGLFPSQAAGGLLGFILVLTYTSYYEKICLIVLYQRLSLQGKAYEVSKPLCSLCVYSRRSHRS